MLYSRLKIFPDQDIGKEDILQSEFKVRFDLE